MVKKFLESKDHAFVIAQIAVIFQSVLTALIIVCLLFSMVVISQPLDTLTCLLILDIAFVILHLSYRGAYRGPKVELKTNQKKILLAHIVTSVIALSATGYFVFKKLDVAQPVVFLVLLVWGVSLVSGIQFFRKKYHA